MFIFTVMLLVIIRIYKNEFFSRRGAEFIIFDFYLAKSALIINGRSTIGYGIILDFIDFDNAALSILVIL
jgi:hypothetical protein